MALPYLRKEKISEIQWLKNKNVALRVIQDKIDTQIEPMRAKWNESLENSRKHKENEKQIHIYKIEIIYDEYSLKKQAIEEYDTLNLTKDEEKQKFITEIDDFKAKIWDFKTQLNNLKMNNLEKDEEIKKVIENYKKQEKKTLDWEAKVRENDKKQTKIQQSVQEIEYRLENEKHQLEKCRENKYTFKNKIVAYEDELMQKNNNLEQINDKLRQAKNSSSDGKDEYKIELESKLETTETKIKDINNEIINYERRFDVKSAQSEIQKLQKELKNWDIAVVNNKKEKSKLEEDLSRLKESIKEINTIKDKMNNREGTKQSIYKRIADKKREISWSKNLYKFQEMLKVNYRRPNSQFKDDMVKGVVINQFAVKHQKYWFPLEIISRSQLLSVIVNDKSTLTSLLKNKCFDHFVKLIPLKDLLVSTIKDEVIARVSKQFKGKATYAIDTINYNRLCERAIRFIFGNYFIWEDDDTAKKIIKQENYVNWITMNGTTYSSSGDITGGKYVNFQQYYRFHPD